eukprot:jgi/Hompol1/5210/HPOL_004234-RA
MNDHGRNDDQEPASIKVMPRLYNIGNQHIKVEYWDVPEREDMLRYSSRYVAGLAATIFVFDVNGDCGADLMPIISSETEDYETSHSIFTTLLESIKRSIPRDVMRKLPPYNAPGAKAHSKMSAFPGSTNTFAKYLK